jgi:hypothetical protein
MEDRADRRRGDKHEAFRSVEDDFERNKHSSSFQDYQQKDMSLQSVEVLRSGQTSFNGAVYDASKQK